MPRLPVSGHEVALRRLDGSDELMLREAAGSPVGVALDLLGRVAGPGAWDALTVTDFEFLLLAVRGIVLGDVVACGFGCPGCREPMEVTFRIAEYVGDIRPRRPRAVTPDPERPGWFLLERAAFRLPTAGDQAAVFGRDDGARLLAERCLDPRDAAAAVRRRIDMAMAAMAPELSRPVAGVCPVCAARVSAPLHVTRLVVTELRRAASGVHDEVNLLAQAYHWDEARILALPQQRRRAYAERIRRDRPEAA